MGKIRQEENAAKGRRERKTAKGKKRKGRRAIPGRKGYEGKDRQESCISYTMEPWRAPTAQTTSRVC